MRKRRGTRGGKRRRVDVEKRGISMEETEERMKWRRRRARKTWREEDEVEEKKRKTWRRGEE